MPNVLCLCGYTQSAAIFRGRIAAIRKQSSSNTTFKFIDPPHIVHSVNLPDSSLVQYDSTASPSSEEETPRAWWFAKDDPSVPGGKRYEGLDETWKMLQDLLESETFDVVLGFSQGAALAGALASRLCRPDNQIKHPPFKLAILVSGFAMVDPEGRLFPSQNDKSPASTLQIIGRGDTIVSSERSQSLVDKFEDPKVEYHDGGHFVPSKANFRRYFRAVFDAIAEGGDSWRDVPSPSNASGTSTPVGSGYSTPTGKL